MKIGFVLLSYADNAPSGIERSVAGLSRGLENLGHDVFVIHATSCARVRLVRSLPLTSVAVGPPVSIKGFEASVKSSWPSLLSELSVIFRRINFDIVCWVDALWGLGCLGAPRGSASTVLMIHVIGDDDAERIRKALGNLPSVVIVPSQTVLKQAAALGLSVDRWRVIGNPLFVMHRAPSKDERVRLWKDAPVRIVSRLGPEKGILELLESIPNSLCRNVEVVLARADFEVSSGAQSELYERCASAAAKTPFVQIMPPLTWTEVPRFLAGASLTIVPSLAETFGLVVLEALSVGTPVTAFDIDNITELLSGGGGVLVNPAQAAQGLWNTADILLKDLHLYLDCSSAAISSSAMYRPDLIAEQWLSAALDGPSSQLYC